MIRFWNFYHDAWYCLCYELGLKDNCRSVFFLMIDQFWVMILILTTNGIPVCIAQQYRKIYYLETITISLKCTDVYLKLFSFETNACWKSILYVFQVWNCNILMHDWFVTQSKQFEMLKKWLLEWVSIWMLLILRMMRTQKQRISYTDE